MAPAPMLAQSPSKLHGEPTVAIDVGVHFWNEHVLPGGQLAHACPPVPHAELMLPPWQNPNWQQPLGQVAGPQP